MECEKKRPQDTEEACGNHDYPRPGLKRWPCRLHSHLVRLMGRQDWVDSVNAGIPFLGSQSAWFDLPSCVSCEHGFGGLVAFFLSVEWIFFIVSVFPFSQNRNFIFVNIVLSFFFQNVFTQSECFL